MSSRHERILSRQDWQLQETPNTRARIRLEAAASRLQNTEGGIDGVRMFAVFKKTLEAFAIRGTTPATQKLMVLNDLLSKLEGRPSARALVHSWIDPLAAKVQARAEASRDLIEVEHCP